MDRCRQKRLEERNISSHSSMIIHDVPVAALGYFDRVCAKNDWTFKKTLVLINYILFVNELTFFFNGNQTLSTVDMQSLLNLSWSTITIYEFGLPALKNHSFVTKMEQWSNHQLSLVYMKCHLITISYM